MFHFGEAGAYKIPMVGPSEKYKCPTHRMASKLYFISDIAIKYPGGGVGRLGIDRVITQLQLFNNRKADHKVEMFQKPQQSLT